MAGKKNQTIHLMGICGTAMGSLAGLLKEMGYEVQGSDQNVYPPMSTRLKALGITLMEGYKPENLVPAPDKVIVGNVMSRTHSEVQALLSSKIPYTSLPQAMGEYLIGDRHSIVIAGTHGKTTTSALCAWVFDSVGAQPGFLVGGVPLNFPNSFSVGKGNYFVIEGDEYDTAFFDKVPKFVHYKPRSVILTSVEFDHADIYKDLDDVKNAFKKLMALIPQDGLLVYNGDDKNIPSLLSSTKCKNLQSYGLKNSDWTLGEIKWTPEYASFDVVHKGKLKTNIKTQMFGEYNLLNALSVYVLATQLGFKEENVLKAMSEFKGVKRRQEIIGKPKGITIIDDFAHHPTAVAVTLDGVKKRFPKSKVIGVFEPRSATSRRKIFQAEFAKALTVGDMVILSSPYDQSKIPADERFDSEFVLNKIKEIAPQKSAVLGHSTEEIIDLIRSNAKEGDVVLFMSNGGFGGIYEKILKTL